MKEFNKEKEFYPTPKALIDKALADLNWKEIGKLENRCILEPSAGKGDFADGVISAFEAHLYSKPEVDCIEINPDLRATLKGKGYTVIADDFLRFHTYKRYELIVMNPPFSNGDEHLLAALELQKNGGSIICILNAESIRNPYTNKRKVLVQKLKDLNASIEFLSDTFSDSERKTDVEIALIKVTIPKKQASGFILESMKKGLEREEPAFEATELEVPDYIAAAVNQYNHEVEAGIRLIEEYTAMQPYLLNSLDNSDLHNEPILKLTLNNDDLSVNAYVENVRQKYWNALFQNPKFTGKMTFDQKTEYLEQVRELRKFDFSVYNILEMQIQMSRTMVQSIEDCIMKLFDKMSAVHSWYPECEKNIHYYNGWTTNKAYMVNRKVILPVNAFDNIFKKFRLSSYYTHDIYDADKVFAYLGADKKTFRSLDQILNDAGNSQETKNIHCPYFDLTFYKKGTVHITFTDDEALKRFNIFGSRMRGWLPQEYGRKHYANLTPEEKAVVDSFEGEVSYEKVVNNRDKNLYNPTNSVQLIAG